MPMFQARRWALLALSCLTICALATLWLVRAAPLVLGLLRADGLSALFLLLALAGVWLGPIWGERPWRALLPLLPLALALLAPYTPLVALGYAALVVFQLAPRRPVEPTLQDRARAALVSAPPLLAAVCLALGYGMLAARGALRYDDRAAGAALDSAVFWFVLLAARGALRYDDRAAGAARAASMP